MYGGLSPSISQPLLKMYRDRALRFGQFTLASGKSSTYYINSKKVLFYAPFVRLLGRALLEATADLTIEGMGGLEVGALPITAAAGAAFAEVQRPLEGFFVRKQPKDHGTGELIEGVLQRGSPVAIVDDVLTTGESARKAIAAVEDAGGIVAAVICLVDRQEGAAQALGNYLFRPLFTVADLGVAA